MDTIAQAETQPDYWQQQVGAWQQSGLSGAKFCQANGLVYHRFLYWRRKLTQKSDEQLTPPSPSGFTQVRYRPDDDTGLTLSLPNGLVVRGICADNVPVVCQLLEAL